MKKMCLITGAGGFVGAAAVRRCLKEGFAVTVLLRKGKDYWRLRDIRHDLTVLEADIADYQVIKVIENAGPQYILHFATYGAYPQETDFDRMVDVNLRGTRHVLEAAKRIGTKLVINTGSSSEYGIKDTPMTETDLPEPVNDYGVTKAAASLYCQKEAKRTGFAVITHRLFSVYGPYEEKRRLIPTLIQGALKGDSIALSSPSNTRDYVYLDDVTDAYIQATQTHHKPGAIYNIGTGHEYTSERVAELVLKLTQSRSTLDWGKAEKQVRQMEPKHWVADRSKAEKVFGWKPKYSLEQGLRKTIDWFLENGDLHD